MVFQPELQVGDERRALLIADLETFVCGQAVVGPLDVEQRVDALHRLERDRRDHRGVLATPGVGGNVGELEEATSAMGSIESM